MARTATLLAAALAGALCLAPAAAQQSQQLNAGHKQDHSVDGPTAFPQTQIVPPSSLPGTIGLSGTGRGRYGFCLPSYSDTRGTLLLQGGGRMDTCVFKGDVTTKTCDCGYYTYRPAHNVTTPSFWAYDYEADRVDHGCTSYAWASATVCDGYRCYSYSYPYCPTGGNN